MGLSRIGFAVVHLDIGDVPTWIASVASTGALIAAGIAARATLRTLKIERTRDQAIADKERVVQASAVTAWYHVDQPDPHTGIPTERTAARVRNGSTDPIWNVQVFFVQDQGEPRPGSTAPRFTGYLGRNRS